MADKPQKPDVAITESLLKSTIESELNRAVIQKGEGDTPFSRGLIFSKTSPFSRGIVFSRNSGEIEREDDTILPGLASVDEATFAALAGRLTSLQQIKNLKSPPGSSEGK
jgi:hypothetical protein